MMRLNGYKLLHEQSAKIAGPSRVGDDGEKCWHNHSDGTTNNGHGLYHRDEAPCVIDPRGVKAWKQTKEAIIMRQL